MPIYDYIFSHIEIIAPNEDEHIYVCRKGYHSLNLLAVCDANMKFIYFVSKWPGSTHDSYAFENSTLREHFRPNNPRRIDGFLLGDSAYSLSPYMFTPFGEPSTPAESRYNYAHASSRNVIERCFGILKGPFRCLHSILHYQPKMVSAIASSCACLHNLARY